MMKKGNTAIVITAIVAIVVIFMFTFTIVFLANMDDGNDVTDSAPAQTQSTTVNSENTTKKEFVANTTTTQQETQNHVDSSEIQLTSSRQYDVNIFLSNFSEIDLKSFTSRPTNSELAKFGVNYNLINRQEKTAEFGEFGDDINGRFMGNVRIKESYVIESIEKFFGITVHPGFANDTIDYYDGYFYTEFTGGLILEGSSFVSKLTYVGDNVYKAEFELYDLGGNDFNYYSYSISQLLNSNPEYIRKCGYGSAYFSATDINNRKTFKLKSYDVTRY